MIAPKHISNTAVPATILVASPPFKSNKSIKQISNINAIGVITASMKAAFE